MAAPTVSLYSESVAFGGRILRYSHLSRSCDCEMKFSVYEPPAVRVGRVPTLYWLSGLECTDENFVQKAGALKVASELGLMIVVSDTSPRGLSLPGEDESWDFGTGAGFYINASVPPYKGHYRMYDYITEELPALIESEFPVIPGLRCISGHSMGGHGALMIALKNPGKYVSVSAFAPIAHPTACAWGAKAFQGYLGSVEAGKEYDSVELIKSGKFSFPDIFVDQGTGDRFMATQLGIDDLRSACEEAGQKLTLRFHEGYDHGFSFISSFIEDHLRYHMRQISSLDLGIITCKAAVAWGPNEPLSIEEIEVSPPRRGEVRIRVVANALCHTDVYTLSGQDPEGVFPAILGHEAGGIVESVGPGVTSVSVGDHVIPAYTPQCGEPCCIFCQSSKTNLCPKIRGTQGKGLMPDGTTRFTCKGKSLFHFMGCSTMSEYTVVDEISCAKIDKRIPLAKACLLGCGVSPGLGAVWNTCKVEPGSTVGVFGLGAVGLAVVQAAKMAGARKIFAIDTNDKKFPIAQSLGATDFINPNTEQNGVLSKIQNMTDSWGLDYTFECIGNVDVMRLALESSHRGWGCSCVVGVAGSGKEICTRPFQLVTGRTWKGTAFGGWKSREAIPRLVQRNLNGELPLDHFVTHVIRGIENTNEAFKALHSGDCLRAVVVSKSVKPLRCGVRDFSIPELGISSARIFYPSESLDNVNVPWFTQREDLPHIVKGKLDFLFNPQTRSNTFTIFVWVLHFLAKFVPTALLPRIPNTSPDIQCLQNTSLPLIVWSHGKGGNIHDHALMLSQFAVEIPAICLCLNHADGSADVWRTSDNKPRYFRHPIVSGSDERYLKEMREMAEYQIQYRCNELTEAVAHVQQRLGFNVSQIFVGGYDLGGATALQLAPKLHAVGAVSIDGTFSVNEKFKFPRDVFSQQHISIPTAFLLSDEWELWNRVMTDNTKILNEKTTNHKLITVKQTKHNNFIELMFWVPQPLVFLLRLAGFIHRRGSPRKTYRRTVKWLVGFIQQYLEGSPGGSSSRTDI